MTITEDLKLLKNEIPSTLFAKYLYLHRIGLLIFMLTALREPKWNADFSLLIIRKIIIIVST